jgi:hypothetical protein
VILILTKSITASKIWEVLENVVPSDILSENLKIQILKTKNLPVVLYGCEPSLLTLIEEHRFGC